MTIYAGSGTTQHDQSYQAGRLAAEQAIAPLNGRSPNLIIIFTTDRYHQAEILQGVRSIAGPLPLIGCCTGGIISNAGIFAQGVVVLALCGDDMEVALAMEGGVLANPQQAAERAAEQIEERLLAVDSGNQNAVLIFNDGLTGTLVTDEMLQYTTDVLGPLCPLVGGAAGDSLQYRHTSLFINDQVASDAVALALISSSAPIGIGVRHGWIPMGSRLVITRSERNTIYELNNQPAFSVYRDMLPYDNMTIENFTELSRFHPFGLPQVGGEFLIRLPLRAYENGAIECLASLPENAVAHIMRGDPTSMLQAAQDAAHQAVQALEGREVAAALIIDCVTRPPLLGHEVETEINLIRDVLGHDTPIAGMYSFGEIAADTGAVAFHNKTVVIYAIGRA